MELFLKKDNNATGTARRITTNFISLTTSEVISKVLQLAVFIYLARVLGKENFGIFSFAFAFAFIVTVVSDFGLSTLFVREISRNKKLAAKYHFNGMIAKVFLSSLVTVFAVIFLNLMGYQHEVRKVAYIILSFTLLQSFTELNYSIFRAFEKMYYEMIIKLLRIFSLVAFVLYFGSNGYDVFKIVLVFPVVELVMLSLSFIFVYKKFIEIKPEFDYNFSKDFLKESSLFFFSIVVTTIYLYVDQVILSKLRGTTEVGVYSAAANIVIALIFIPLVYCNSIYPVISRLYITSKKSLKLAYERSFKYMLLLGLPIAVGIYALAGKIILLLYGKDYSNSAIVLGILSGYIFLKFLNPVTGFTLMATNKQKTRLYSQSSAAVINVILNLMLIPFYGVTGAAIATLLTEIIFFIIYTSVIVKYGFSFRFLLSFIHKPLIAAAMMAFALLFIGNLFLAVFIGFFVYASALLILKIVDSEDKQIFYKIVKNL